MEAAPAVTSFPWRVFHKRVRATAKHTAMTAASVRRAVPRRPARIGVAGGASSPGSRTPAPREAAPPTDPASQGAQRLQACFSACPCGRGLRWRLGRNGAGGFLPAREHGRVRRTQVGLAHIDVDRHQRPTSWRMRAVEAGFPEPHGRPARRAREPQHPRTVRIKELHGRCGNRHGLSGNGLQRPGIVAQVAQGVADQAHERRANHQRCPLAVQGRVEHQHPPAANGMLNEQGTAVLQRENRPARIGIHRDQAPGRPPPRAIRLRPPDDRDPRPRRARWFGAGRRRPRGPGR